MQDRQQFAAIPEISLETHKFLEESKRIPVTDEELREQRISFAYGNALESDYITKESVRHAAASLRLPPQP